MSLADLVARDGHVARWLIERGLAAIYVIAFLVAWRQFPAPCGERGLTPAARVLGRLGWRHAPSLFQLGYSDRRLRVVTAIGMTVAAALVLGLPQRGPLAVTMLALAVAWALYLSIVNIGGTFYAFGWVVASDSRGRLRAAAATRPRGADALIS